MSIFGKSWMYPESVSAAGSFETSAEIENIWSSVDHIVDTPRGTCPLDPNFGISPDLYEVFDTAAAFAYSVAEAIERSEPRVRDIQITIQNSTDPDTIYLDISIKPIGTNRSYNRVFPFFRKV